MPPITFWFCDVPAETRFPKLTEDSAVDVAVVGGGMAGLSAAYFLQDAGLTVALLEATSIGEGDSGFTMASATRFLDTLPATMTAWEASQAAITLMAEVIDKEKIDCDWEYVDGIGFTRTRGAARLKQAFDKLRRHSPEIEFFEGVAAAELTGFPVAACYRQPLEAQFHMRKFLFRLADVVFKQGARIYEGTPVKGIGVGDNVVLKTPKGTVTASRVVIATGCPPSALFPAVSDMLQQVKTHVIQAAFPDDHERPQPIARALLWDDETPFHYLRWVSELDLLVSGDGRALEDYLKELVVQPFSLVNAWQGTSFYTKDALPCIGAHSAYGERVLFATGWGRNGCSQAFLTGQILALMVKGKEHNLAKLFSFNRRTIS